MPSVETSSRKRRSAVKRFMPTSSRALTWARRIRWTPPWRSTVTWLPRTSGWAPVRSQLVRSVSSISWSWSWPSPAAVAPFEREAWFVGSSAVTVGELPAAKVWRRRRWP